MEKNNPKVIRAWCSYDMANSSYNLIITSVLFPLYYQLVTAGSFKDGFIPVLGFKFQNTVIYDFAIALAYFVIIFLTPMLSGIADMGGYRKRFMRVFTTLGALSCAGLFWFDGDNIGYGLLLVGLAVIGYAGSLVYYNSFLPIIATPNRHDRISAKGFSWGYIGSMVLLVLCLVMIMNFEKFGIPSKLYALRISFLAVGVWWFGLSQIAFWYLKEYPGQFKFGSHVFSKGFHEIVAVSKDVHKNASMRWYLFAFWFFSMGVQTTMLVAALFGSKELGVTGTKLIVTILLIQILGIVGASLFGEVSTRRGNKLSLLIMINIWIGICITAYFIRTEVQFYILAATVGMVMGGIQSQARSTFSKLIPAETTDTASYFSFYDITEKIAIVLGMFSFGLMEHLTGSMRSSTILLSIFFIISFVLLSFTNLKFVRE
jgi:MFS transporter, UMF1 family